MQIDFHHAVTYVLARLAGFTDVESRTIAYAAQYVDDCTNSGLVNFDTGTTYYRIASAHKTTDFIHHCDIKDDCRVWVPFHFLPGNVGARAGEVTSEPMIKRLVCMPDSPIATDTWNACYRAKNKPGALHRLGITTHVYEDTFAHCDFAGLLDNVNSVSKIAHGAEQFRALVDNLCSQMLQIIPLGHGAVLCFPDWPFLEWGYRNHDGVLQQRNNPERFLSASEKVFQHFLFFREQRGRELPPQDRVALERAFRSYAETEGKDRHSRWMKLIREGGFSFGGLDQKQADALLYKDRGTGSWKCEALGVDADKDDSQMQFHYTPDFESSNWRLFHDALKEHQAEVLNNILPKYGLSLPLQTAKS